MKRLAGLAFLLAGFAPQAQAVEVCVATVTEFYAALSSARFAPTTIMLERGSYSIGDLHYIQYTDLALLGGYGPGCGSRTVDPANTVVQQTFAGGYFRFLITADLTLEGITFADIDNGVDLEAGDGIIGEPDIEPSIDLTVHSSVFRGASLGPGLTVEWDMSYNDSDSVGHLRLVNSLIHANSGPGTTCALQVTSYSPDFSASLVNNSVASNAGFGGACLETSTVFDDDAELLARVYNNIFWNNGVDLYSNMTALLLVNNVIGNGNYPTPIFPVTGTQTGNPLFVAAGSGNFNLQAASPAVNSGSNSAPGGLPPSDLDGGPRLIGNAVDRGALESAVSNVFFQVVTNVNDSGLGSLRQALINANLNADFNIVQFDIPGACPHRIDLDSVLPNVMQPVLIDGYSQPGSSINDQQSSDNANRCVRLNGGDTRAHGLRVGGGAAASVQLWVKGLAFGGFANAAIDLQGGSDHIIEGNYFGDGVGVLTANRNNIILGGTSTGTRIGGSHPAQRNVIVAALDDGIRIEGSGSLIAGSYANEIINNFIGVRSNGGSAGSNAYGIVVRGADNTIEGNVISGNRVDGVLFDGSGASGNALLNNRIGSNSSGVCFPLPCTPALANDRMGVMVQNAAHDNRFTGNIVSYNGDDGVRVLSGARNRIRLNTITGNGALGIDLDANGVSANDNDGAIVTDTLANRLINFPILASALGAGYDGRLSGQLQSINDTYKIEIYANNDCASSGHGQGGRRLKTLSVTIANAGFGQNGSVVFNTAIHSDFGLYGQAISATATDSAGNTSEFSACVDYVDDVIFAHGFE